MTISKKFNKIFTGNSDFSIFHELVGIKGINCKLADVIVEHYQWREYSDINIIIRKIKETNPTLLNK